MSGTEQEAFWRGDFGDAYVDRSQGEALLASRTHLWGQMLKSMPGVSSITEFGANIGLNLRALHTLRPEATLKGVEINPKAAAILKDWGRAQVFEGPFPATQPDTPSDLAFTCTVLIHINPDNLPACYDALAAHGRRYVVICEYYNPAPTEISYRGHSERLFKRDFAGEFLDRHPDFALKDYGFLYHRDPVFPADDFTWFVMERRAQTQ